MKYRVDLSFKNKSTKETNIKLKRGDYGSDQFIFNITDNINYDSYQFRVRFINELKETSEYTSVTVENNQLIYTIDNFVLQTKGVVMGEVSRHKVGERDTSCTFIFEVLEDISVDYDVVHDDRFPVLDEAINTLNNIYDLEALVAEAEYSATKSRSSEVKSKDSEDNSLELRNQTQILHDNVVDMEVNISNIEDNIIDIENNITNMKVLVETAKSNVDGQKELIDISERNAKDSENKAKISEENSLLSETNAKTSELNAKASEDNVITKEQNVIDKTSEVYNNTQIVLQKAQEVSENNVTVYDNTQLALEYKNETERNRDDVQANTNIVVEKERIVSEKTDIVLQKAQDVSEKALQVSEDTEEVSVNKDTVLSNANTVSLNKEATDENKLLSEQYKNIAEQKATASTEQALLSKYYADLAQSIASSIPMRYYRKTVEDMNTIVGAVQGSICYVTNFEDGISDLYVYDTTDMDEDNINPEWVFLGRLEFANMDKETLLGILELATVAITGDYADLINKPKRYEGFITITNGVWDYNYSDKILLTTTNLVSINNVTNGAIGYIYTDMNLNLPANSKTTIDYNYITISTGQFYQYSFVYNGTNYIWSRTVV